MIDEADRDGDGVLELWAWSRIREATVRLSGPASHYPTWKGRCSILAEVYCYRC